MPPISYDEVHGYPSGYYPPTASAEPPGLPPHLEAAVKSHQLTHYADPICPRCRLEAPDGNAVNGRCPHRPSPQVKAQQDAWHRKAYGMRLAQQLAAGQLGNSVRVVPFEQALTEDSLKAALHEVIDQLG